MEMLTERKIMDYQTLNEKLYWSLMNDLENPEQRNPQLYKVVLDVLKENRDQLELTERNIDKVLEEKIDLPFKFGS
tara:strand:+ start:1350 stop:1577 length:228 start_codon:yes stop_codon:yes gene_type:complete